VLGAAVVPNLHVRTNAYLTVDGKITFLTTSGFHRDVDKFCPLLCNNPQERISLSSFNLRPIPSFLNDKFLIDALGFCLQTYFKFC
jgi:hypothetical protein